MVEKKVKHDKKWIYISITLLCVLIFGAIFVFQNKIIQTTTVSSTDCGEGTIVASDKTLCWEKNTIISVKNWEEANNYCDSLILAEKEDWRLPNIQELSQIIEMNHTGLKINETLFPNTFQKNYWTSSEYNNPEMHWFVHFSTGYQGHGYDYNSGYAVRCIREIKIV